MSCVSDFEGIAKADTNCMVSMHIVLWKKPKFWITLLRKTKNSVLIEHEGYQFQSMQQRAMT